ncbi:MAG: bacterial Ig-like domain-containing protein, partial [Muribaculaceae bacterium]|nr:bacterial Ig-like domain-containing protein [Muribaculaceae bacterium]
ITPKTGVVVTITENSSELVYNTEEQSVEGYTYSINDELNIYSEEDFSFSGNAVAAGTTVGTYPMELSVADFSNTNANFADVRFVIVDGALTITKAPEAPNKPVAAMETRYIVIQLVALPENWKWADEQQALEEGSNVATANYVGADKGNYVIESVDVTITRLECLHNEGNEVLYTLEPTCTHKGYTGNLSCKLCGEIYEMGDSIPALGHDFVETVVAPTCTTDGYTTHFCARDNYTEYSDTVPATGHKEDVAVFENIVAATCTEAGSQDSVVYCSVCKEELSRTVLEIPATGHKDSVVIENIVRPTLEAAGSYDSVVYCSVCKVELSRKTIDVLASAVAVSKLPNKVEYKQGEALDVKGGKLTATYSDESTAEFEMLAGWVSGFDSEKVGKQILTVKFETVSSTLTTTFDVTVSAKDDDTAISEEAENEVSIYAYQNVIVVEAADAITGEIAVFDVNGRMVRKTLAAGTRTEIEMPRQGLYIVRVGNQAKRVVIK